MFKVPENLSMKKEPDPYPDIGKYNVDAHTIERNFKKIKEKREGMRKIR